MAMSYSLPVVVFVCLATVAVCFPHQKLYMPANIPDTSQQVPTASWWSQTFTDVGDKTSCPSEPWSKSQDHARVRRVPMLFERPMSGVPMVHLSVTELRARDGERLQYQTRALDITNEGFVLEFRVFCDTFIDRVEVEWLALA